LARKDFAAIFASLGKNIESIDVGMFVRLTRAKRSVDQANAAFILILRLSRDQNTRGQALQIYEELKAVAAAHPTENEIRFDQASAALILLLRLARDESTRERAMQICEELRAVAAPHPTETKINVEEIEYPWILIGHLLVDEGMRKRALQICNELMASVGDEPSIDETFKTVFQFTMLEQLIEEIGRR
jgi:hypothetical protein